MARDRDIQQYVHNFTREDLYTYKEATGVLGVSAGAISTAATTGIFTTLRLQHHQEKFIPKYEVDALVGTGVVISKKARETVEQARRQHGAANPQNEYLSEEMSYGDPFHMTPALPAQKDQSLADKLIGAYNNMCETLKVLGEQSNVR